MQCENREGTCKTGFGAELKISAVQCSVTALSVLQVRITKKTLSRAPRHYYPKPILLLSFAISFIAKIEGADVE